MRITAEICGSSAGWGLYGREAMNRRWTYGSTVWTCKKFPVEKQQWSNDYFIAVGGKEVEENYNFSSKEGLGISNET